MAVMVSADRAECWADFMRTTDVGEVFNINKTDLRAAIDATDQWVSDNQSSFNTAIPLPARTSLSTVQKSRLLIWALRWRYLKGV